MVAQGSSLTLAVVFEVPKSGCHSRGSHNVSVRVRELEYCFQPRREPKLWNLWMPLAMGDSRESVGQTQFVRDSSGSCPARRVFWELDSFRAERSCWAIFLTPCGITLPTKSLYCSECEGHWVALFFLFLNILALRVGTVPQPKKLWHFPHLVKSFPSLISFLHSQNILGPISS